MKRMNNQPQPVRLVSREQNLSFAGAHDYNADGIINSTEDQYGHLRLIDGGLDDNDRHDQRSYSDYDDYDSYDDVDSFYDDFQRDSERNHNKLTRKVVMLVGAVALAATTVFGASAIESRLFYDTPAERGVEATIGDNGALDAALIEAAHEDPSLAVVVNRDIRKARDDAIRLNPDQLDANGDGALDALQSGVSFDAPTYPTIDTNK